MPIPLSTLPGRTLLSEGRELLYFGGTGYLGMHQNAGFQALIAEGLAKYGGHFGGSRLSHLQIDIFEAAEAHIAALTGAGSAAIFSSGTLAGQCAAQFLKKKHLCRFAPGTHPALWNGAALFQGDFEQWVAQVLDEAYRRPGPMALFSNALDPLYARQFHFNWIRELPSDLPVVLVLDDSHGIGITGRDGGGIFTQIDPPENVSLLVIASLGKAPGIPAGAVFGRQELVEAIRQSPLFGGASPPVPAFLHAFVHAAPIYRRNRERLRARIRQFAGGLAHPGQFSYIPEYPVFYTPHNGLAAALEAKGILIPSFPYPTAADAPVTRIVLNALHTEEDVARLLHSL